MKVLMSIGNPLKGDDNIGNVVLDKISLNIRKIRAETTPENYFKELERFNEVFILDALEFNGKVGDVKIFELHQIDEISLSTHSIPMKLIKNFLPKAKIKIIGIQPKKIEFGEMSKELKEKIDDIVKEIEKIIS